MADILVTPTWTGNEILAVADNETRFVKGITKKLEGEFVQGGVKLGATVGVHLPPQYLTTKGAAFVAQSIVDNVVYITITDQANIGSSMSSTQVTMDILDAYEQFVNPAAIQMANTWDKDGLSRLYQDVYQAQGTPGTVPTANTTYLNAAVNLAQAGVPTDSRTMVVNSMMGTAIANVNTTLFGPRGQIDDAWQDGMLAGPALRWKQWWEDENVYPHTYGTYSGTPTVNGANQTGSTLVTQSWGSGVSTLNKGDVFTIGSGTTGVYGTKAQSNDNTTQLQKFVVTQTISDTTGAMTISISPSIVTSGAYQTVVASPANLATINVLGASGTISNQGLGFHKQAFVMASVPPVMPKSGKARIMKRGQVAIRIWEDSDIMTDQHPTRLDSFYGFKTVRPSFAVRIQS